MVRAVAVAAALALLPPALADVFNPLAYGAKGDGRHDDTAAMRAATAALAAAGSGTLLLPAGLTFLTGPINLTSNTLFLLEGTLLASNSSEQYPLIPPLPWYGGGQDAPMSGAPEWHPVVMIPSATNVTITGGGVLDGNGAAWYACAAQHLKPAPCDGYSRPQLLRPVHVQGFELSNVTLRDSAAWTVHLANVTDAWLHNFTVTAPYDEGNTDGVDVDCSRRVLIQDFVYAGGDDAVAVKAGEDWLGYTYGAPTRDVLVERLTVLTGNGFAVGSETSAGVANVTFRDVTVNCTAAAGGPVGPNQCKHGLYIKSCRGRGGVIRNITVDNCVVDGVVTGHGFTLAYQNVPPTNATATPRIEGVTITGGLIAHAAEAFGFVGLADSVITGVSLSGVQLAGGVHTGSQCAFTTGACSGMADGACPPCLTPS